MKPIKRYVVYNEGTAEFATRHQRATHNSHQARLFNQRPAAQRLADYLNGIVEPDHPRFTVEEGSFRIELTR